MRGLVPLTEPNSGTGWGESQSIPPLDGFDRRLEPSAAAPIAVAYSGGGDSLMALKAAKAWADLHGRRVVALTVDHGLQSASGAWTRQAAQAAERLGVTHHALIWSGEKPTAGLADAARAARHRLIADAARAMGARVAVFGHTADDVIEGELMRAQGLRLGRLREWGPSPVWPEGRGVFILRPLLGVRRAAIRRDLAACDETWIDDPANEDPRSPRARARAKAGRITGVVVPSERHESRLAALASAAMMVGDGSLRFERERLLAAPREVLHRLLAVALTCAGGSERPPRGKPIEALAARLTAQAPFAATLCGAKLLAEDQVLIVRDVGEARRGGLAPLALPPHRTGVWDRRFEATSGDAPMIVSAVAGRMKSLSKTDAAWLRTCDRAVRPTLPVFNLGEKDTSCPILAADRSSRVRSLVEERFLAGCAVYLKEPAT